MGKLMIALSGVSKNYDKRTVIKSVSLACSEGEVICITGSSGIGKSTLLEIMAGIISHDKGEVQKETEPALMFQDNALIPWLNAKENITYILPKDMAREKAAQTALYWLNRFHLEENLFLSEMSSGMQRRLSLARTFASGRKLLLLDEPFAFLDEAWQKKIAYEIATQVANGACVVLASHTIAPLLLPCFENIEKRIFSISKAPVLIEELHA